MNSSPPEDERTPAGPDRRKLNALGQLIREKRNLQKLSLEKMSAKVGKSVATLSRIESGLLPIDVGMLLALSDALGCSAAALLLQAQVQESPSKADRRMWLALKELVK